MQIKTFSKLAGALAYLFGKVSASEDSGVVVVVAFWLGKYWVLADTHLTKRPPDAACAHPRKYRLPSGSLFCPDCDNYC